VKTQSILYISYDGMLEPLGQSQVLAYLDRLSVDWHIHLISFEKTDDWLDLGERQRLENYLESTQIFWHPLRYHKRPSALATAWDIFCGLVLGLFIVFRHQINIIHARSYVPSVIALMLKRLTGVKYLFDMRGFWADERVDGGLWKREGFLFRLSKKFERKFLKSADHVVSLTHAAVCEIERFDYLSGHMPAITVIPTCADLDRFRPLERKDESIGFVLGYVGSAGTWYLFDEVVACFSQLLLVRPDSYLLILNRGEHHYIRHRLSAAGIPEEAVELKAASHDEVPIQIARMDAGVFFIKPVFSKQASAPTKLAEFLGCGKPCLSNVGVGDMASVLEKEFVGVALKSFDQKSLAEGVKELLLLTEDQSTSTRCVVAAHKYFSLDEGVRRYAAIYRHLSA
jgi:glycosyltransferase involved in cell wall biosynthesis